MHVFAPFESEEGKELAEQMREAMSIDDSEFEILSTVRYDPILMAKNLEVDGNETGQSEINGFQNAQRDHPNGARGAKQPQMVPSENNFFLLPYHWERLKFSIAFFEWPFDVPYSQLLGELLSAVRDLNPLDPYKLRVLVSRNGKMKVEAIAVVKRNDLMSGLQDSIPPGPENPQYSIYLDTQPTLVSAFTSFKTTKRDVYSSARERALPKDTGPSEVLMYNTRNMITEGSITNVAFLRDGRWITPAITSGCLCGVVRHHLLVEGLVEEGNIELASVATGEKILVFNAIIGVCSGVVMPRS
jgi:4-amino-4-deoxychorismate lyase